MKSVFRIFSCLFLAAALLSPLGGRAAEIDVVLIGGQSNATGQGYMANLPRSFKIATSVLFFHSPFLNRGNGADRWGPLRQASETPDKFGVELSLGTALQHFFPKRRIALVKHALSGSNLHTQWNPGNRPGERAGSEYKKFIRTVRKALKVLQDRGDTPVIRAMVWQQGEADARYDAGRRNSLRYGENLRNLILRIRKDLQVPDMLFVYGEVMPMEAKRFSYRKEVREAQHLVDVRSKSALSTPGAYCLEGDDLQMRRNDYHTPYPQDDVHLGTFGILSLGERFAAAIRQHGMPRTKR